MRIKGNGKVKMQKMELTRHEIWVIFEKQRPFEMIIIMTEFVVAVPQLEIWTRHFEMAPKMKAHTSKTEVVLG
jgi:hypothetical protein